ncbi:MAG: S24 family peptidase [Candidatus Adiutrix sp.]
MNNLNEIFRQALIAVIPKTRGAQARLAEQSGVLANYLNRIIKGTKPGSEGVRRRIAATLGFPGARYEDFLAIGRCILSSDLSVEVNSLCEPRPCYLAESEMLSRDFFAVAFSKKMRLIGGKGGCIPITSPDHNSHLVVHGPSIGRTNSKNLQGFHVPDHSMEPLIGKDGIALADLSHNNTDRIKSGGIYILCWDFLSEASCAIRRLKWVERNRLLSIESENKLFEPIYKEAKDVLIIGKVIWSSRSH